MTDFASHAVGFWNACATIAYRGAIVSLSALIAAVGIGFVLKERR